MLEDRAKGVVFVAMSVSAFNAMSGWSEPPSPGSDPELQFRKLAQAEVAQLGHDDVLWQIVDPGVVQA